MPGSPRDFSDLVIAVRESARLTAAEREALATLFRGSYRGARLAYLEQSLGQLASCAIATTREGVPAGFALGEMRVMELPRLPQQEVALAGLCCVAPVFRRRGLFARLESLALRHSGLVPRRRLLSAGRTAHPASLRLVRRLPGAVPRPGVVPTPWQQEVGSAIAAAYGAHGFDPTTFVLRGSGAPIGEPLLEMEVDPEDRELFAAVDRSRGDSLLGLGWHPTPPEHWEAER